MDSTSSLWLPPAGSTLAGEIDPLFNFILYACTVFFAIVVFGIIYFGWRYRRRRQAGLVEAPTHNTALELVWTILPTILLAILFVWGTKSFIRMHVAPKDALEIKATGQKWFWSFDYPNGATTVNELVVPVHKPVKLLLSSKDVIHSFYVPNFRIKMDALPNRYTIAWFEAIRSGEYQIFCAEFCGKGHSEMLGTVRVVGDLQYARWLDSSASMGEGLAPEEYGKQLFKAKACYTCHSVDGSKLVGPSLLGRFGTQETMKGGEVITVDENYLRESLLNPKAKVVNGFDPVMPTYQTILKDKQIDALIAYIKSLK